MDASWLLGSARFDEQTAKLGIGIEKRDDLFVDARERCGRVGRRQLEEILYRVFLGVLAVEVDVDRKLELAVAVLANAIGRRRAFATRIAERLVQIEDHLGHELVQMLILESRAQEQVPFVWVLAVGLFQALCFVADFDYHLE